MYQGQPLIDLLNMSAGDSHLMEKGTTRWKGHPGHHRGLSLSEVAKITRGDRKSGSGVFYNNTLTDLIANYTEYKTGEDYDGLVEKSFKTKRRFRSRFTTNGNTEPRIRIGLHGKDLLRVAIAMMEDYQAGNCVGQYLKDLQAQKSFGQIMVLTTSKLCS